MIIPTDGRKITEVDRADVTIRYTDIQTSKFLDAVASQALGYNCQSGTFFKI